MASLTLRSVKGTPLTNAEVDANFTALNTELATMLVAATAASTYLALSGGTLTGKLNLPASTTSAAPVNIGSGTAPSSPVSGDVWIGSSGLQYRQDTVTQTVALLGASQTFTGAVVFSGNLTAQATVNLGSGSGTITNQLGYGATTSGNTKTVGIGTGGLSGSTTNITIGSQYGTSITSYGSISHTGTFTAGGLIESTTGGFKFPDGTIQTTAGGGGGGGSGTYYVSSSAPGSPASGDRWLDTDTGIEYTYFSDGNTNQWVELGNTAFDASNYLPRRKIVDHSYKFYDSTTTNTLLYTNGSVQRWAPAGGSNPTLVISNWPGSGELAELLIEGQNLGGAGTITWPTINWIKADGTFTTTFSNLNITLQTGNIDFIILWTRDGGTTVYGKVIR